MKKFIQISVIVLFVLAVAGSIFLARSTNQAMAGGVVLPNVGWNSDTPNVGWNTDPMAGGTIFYKIIPSLPAPCVGWNS